MMKVLLTVCLLLGGFGVFAQEAVDTLQLSQDTIVVRKGGKTYTAAQYSKRFQPRKAILYAAVFPGAGQIYTRKYWKLPLVYGGLFMVTNAAIVYQQNFLKYQKELYGLIENPSIPSPSGYNKEQLRILIDAYRRERDFMLILDGIIYLLQMVDAHVDAHLKEFDLNPKLRVTFEPTTQPSLVLGAVSGFSLTIKF